MNTSSQFGRSYDLDLDTLTDSDDESPDAQSYLSSLSSEDLKKYKVLKAKEKKLEKLKEISGETKPRPKGTSKMPEGETDPMKTEIDGTPFNVLLQQAVKLKGAQQSVYRNKFDGWARWYQNSVFAGDDVKLARTGTFEGMYELALKYKDDGSALFTNKSRDFSSEASNKYETGISMFKYATNNDPEWKSKGMHDDSLTEHTYTYTTTAEKQLVEEYIRSCLLNLSLCYSKMAEYNLSVLACTEALIYDDKSVKAYYRRAISRLQPVSAGAVEQEMAVKDLVEANRLDPGDKTVKKELDALKAKIKVQKGKDKVTYKGFLNRGTIYNTDKNPQDSKPAVVKEINEEEEVNDYKQLHKQMEKAEGVYEDYVRNGDDEDAVFIRKQIDNTKSVLDRNKQKKEEAASAKSKMKESLNVNFDKPTQAMIDDGKLKGIDLADPRVKSMLKNLQSEKNKALNTNATTTVDDDEIAKRAKNVYVNETKVRLNELVSDMSQDDVVNALTEMDVPFTKPTKSNNSESMAYLKNKFIEALLDGKELPRNLSPTKTLKSKVLNFINEYIFLNPSASATDTDKEGATNGKGKGVISHIKTSSILLLVFITFRGVYRVWTLPLSSSANFNRNWDGVNNGDGDGLNERRNAPFGDALGEEF